MQNTNRKGALLGIGLLSMSSLMGIVEPTLAGPKKEEKKEVKEERRDVKEAKKEVKQERKDVRKADSSTERRRERQELNQAQRELKTERQELKQDKRDVNRYKNDNYKNGYNGNYRNGYNRRNDDFGYDEDRRYDYNRRSNYRSIEGVVVNDLRGNGFTLRTENGRDIRVQVQGGEPKRLDRGDYVRLYGFASSGTFHAQNVSILRNR